MKKLLLALIGVAAFAFAGGAWAADLPVKAAPAAQQTVSGYLGMYVGGSWWDWGYNDPSSGSNAVFGGESRVNVWWSPNWSTQFDIEGEATSRVPTNGNMQGGAIHGLLGGHLAWRDPNSYALGVLAAAIAQDSLYWNYNWAVHGLFGVEGQRYIGNFTLYGQAGLLHRFTYDNYDPWTVPQYLWFVRGVGRYFFTPNDKLQAEVGYASGKNDFQDSTQTIWNWGALWEHKFAGPFSGFLEYAGWRYNDTDTPTYTVTSHNFLVGAKVYFGQPTLLANDRNGATFDMPKFIRALPWSDMADY